MAFRMSPVAVRTFSAVDSEGTIVDWVVVALRMTTMATYLPAKLIDRRLAANSVLASWQLLHPNIAADK